MNQQHSTRLQIVVRPGSFDDVLDALATSGDHELEQQRHHGTDTLCTLYRLPKMLQLRIRQRPLYGGRNLLDLHHRGRVDLKAIDLRITIRIRL